MTELGLPAPGVEVARPRIGAVAFDATALRLDAKGQDRHLVRDGFVAVADGSSPADGSHGGAVAAFAERALANLHAARHRSLNHQFADAIERTAVPGLGISSPSCAVGLVQSRGDELEIAVLADILVVVQHRGGLTVVRDERVRVFDDRTGSEVARRIALGEEHAAARAAIRPMLEDQFTNYRNHAGGYWVFADDPRAASELITARVPAADVEAVLICSDGFARLWDLFGNVPSARHLLEACRADLGRLGTDLRALERQPDSLVRFPRTSIHDDATAVLLQRH